MALLFAYGQSSHGVATPIRDTPRDDLSIQKSNEVCWDLRLRKKERKKERGGKKPIHRGRSKCQTSRRVRETCGGGGGHSRAPRGGSPDLAEPTLLSPGAHAWHMAGGRPLAFRASFGHRTHAVGQKSNRTDFKIQSIKRLPERKRENESQRGRASDGRT